jgi:hypothetical protein
MKAKIVWTVLLALVINGCVGTPDEEGWRWSQKDDFLEILSDDKYASICDDTALYQQVKKRRNSRLMSKLLVAYTENLANGCIDIEAFNKSQEQRAEKEIESNYDFYLQEVKSDRILAQLRAGQSIENILKPYLPATEQFALLTQKYQLYKEQGGLTPKQLHTLRLNIERTKLMYPNLGENYALINVPEFKVRLKNGNQTALQFGVIVGKSRLQTPIFAQPMQYITLNPQWGVPDSIARNEVIPKLLKDPTYLAKNNLVIRQDYNLDSPQVDLESIDLEAYNGGKGEVPFKFIERPSKGNVLGRMKFIFPNKYSVYMHDTQTKYLFKRKVRTFSHGCVRLEKPNALLQYITTNFTDETIESMTEKYNSLETEHIPLIKPLMVQTAYLTAYVDESGNLLMFKDYYGFDRLQKLNF